MSFFDSIFGDDLSKEAQVKHDLAVIHLEKGNYREALELLEEAEELEPGHDDLVKLRARIEAEYNTPREEVESEEELNFDDPWLALSFDEFDNDRIQVYTLNGYRIENVAYGKGKWHVILRHAQKGDPVQKYLWVDTIDDDTFNTYMESRFAFKTIAHDGLNWFFVFDERPSADFQAWVFAPNEFPKEELKDWETRSGRVEHLYDFEGRYFTSATFPNTLEGYKLERYEDLPEERIDELWNNDQYVDRVFKVKDYFFLVTAVHSDWEDQGFLTRFEYPTLDILQKMRDGYTIGTLFFHDDMWYIFYHKEKLSATMQSNPQGAADEIYNPEEKVEPETAKEENPETAKEELEKALNELESLVGMAEVKHEVKLLLDYLKIGQIKERSGIETLPLNLHMVFSGSPGTGKTTVARLIGRIYKAMGLLKSGHVVETDRGGLVAEYIGQTAPKTQKKLEESEGGILFVDEAYSLYKGGSGDFGKEAVETILKKMEDDRSSFCVIFAGYPDEMEELMDSNPGLKSRFATHLHFSNFSANELMSIFKKMLFKAQHQLSLEAEEKAVEYFQYLTDTADKYFGNAREARNLFEDVLKNQSGRLAEIIADFSGSDSPLSQEVLKTISVDDIRASYGFGYAEKQKQSIDDILAQLDELIGLENIKEDIKRLARYLQVQKERQKQGWESDRPTLHAVFLGPPGTGKTTIARLLAKIYKALDLIKKDELVEVGRSDLVAGYVGQTAIKTNKIIDRAMHGVLFIDEAYALTSRGDNDFGHEAVETLLKRMEDDRDDLVVIVAGYDNEMKEFVESNPGLESRFSRKFNFRTFSAEELVGIFNLMVKKSHYKVSMEALPVLEEIVASAVENKSQHFGNARWVRNFFDRCKMEQAQRISREEYIDENVLQLLTVSDLNRAHKIIQQEDAFARSKRSTIGYKRKLED